MAGAGCLSPVHKTLARYINALQIIHPDGVDLDPPIYQLCYTAYNPTQRKTQD
jgi:hypothetical protein